MDKIDKFTQKLKHDVATRVLEELKNLRMGNIGHLDIKKLKGGDIYRVRVGKVRIRFVRTDHGNLVVGIGFRDDNTY